MSERQELGAQADGPLEGPPEPPWLRPSGQGSASGDAESTSGGAGGAEPASHGLLLAAAAGLALVGLGAYHVWHRGSLAASAKLLRPAWDLTLLGLFFLSATTLGARISRLLGYRPRDVPLALAVSAGLGFAVFSQVALLLAVAKLVNVSSLVIVIALPPLLDRKLAVEVARAAWRAPRRPESVAGWVLAGALVVMGVLALSPPCWIDPLAYHLVVPQEYLRAGGVPAQTETVFTFLPAAMAMLYLYLMGLGSDFLPKLLHFCFFLMLALVVYRVARARFGPRVARFSALLFCAGEWVVHHGVQRANVDFHAAFYSVAGLLLVLEVLLSHDGDTSQRAPKADAARHRRGALLAAALLVGTAMAGKYTAIGCTFGIELALLVALLRKRVSFKEAVLFNVVAAAVLAPTMLRNVIHTGDPLFWFFTGALGRHEHLSAAQLQAIGAMRGLLHPKLDLTALVMMPIWAYIDGRFPSTNFDGFITPFYLVFLPLSLLLARRRPWISYLFLFFVGFYPFWLQTSITRYALPVLPLFAVLTALVLDEGTRALSERSARLAAGAWGAALVLFCVLQVAKTVRVRRYFVAHNAGVFFGLFDRKIFMRGTLARDLIAASDYLVKKGAKKDRVFMVFGEQLYYFAPRAYGDPLKVNLITLREAKKRGVAPAVWLRRHGFKWLIFDASRYHWWRNYTRRNKRLAPYPEAMAFLDGMMAFFKREVAPGLRPEKRFGAHLLYRVPQVGGGKKR